MKIELDKIITQAITTVVVAVFMGACVIVWKGATSVDVKVNQTREDMQHLIDSLSDKLAEFQVRLTSISNQLTSLNKQIALSTDFIPKTMTTMENPAVQQKAYRQDIYQQLKK